MASVLTDTSTPRPLALRPEAAAASIGASEDFFRKHVMPRVGVVDMGRVKLVPVAELERWLDEEASRGDWT